MKRLKTPLFALLCIAALGLLALSLALPAERSEHRSATVSPGSLFGSAVQRQKAAALGELVSVPIRYSLPEGLTVAPEPDPDGYRFGMDAAQTRAVLDGAKRLLGDRTPVWSEETPVTDDEGVSCYCDDSLLALVWNEEWEGNTLSFLEVFLSDGSQLRRKLASDEYGEGYFVYPTDMSAACNAAAACSGDFYRFRSVGVNIYERTAYRAVGKQIDSCFFDANGDMHFAYAGEITDMAAAQRFADENDIVFSVAFGPVLIDGGECVCPTEYPIGEILYDFPRCVFGQIESLHYLIMTTSPDGTAADVTALMAERGCINAYMLDGGQSATLILDNKQLNRHTRYRTQRVQSDIIYFASAVQTG